MTWWQTIDVTLFHWINTDLSNAVFDAVLPLCRERWVWAPLYLFFLAFIWMNYRTRKGLVLVFGLLIAVGLADFTSSTLIKKNIQRIRPCNDVHLRESVRARAPCGSGYSFTSSHAANHFAVAVYLSGALGGAFFFRLRLLLLLWASLVAFSQVYVGVHYPGDVLGGAALGAAVGWWVVNTFRRWGWLPRNNNRVVFSDRLE